MFETKDGLQNHGWRVAVGVKAGLGVGDEKIVYTSAVSMRYSAA
jgi:hypothetical protein